MAPKRWEAAGSFAPDLVPAMTVLSAMISGIRRVPGGPAKGAGHSSNDAPSKLSVRSVS
jgi:hypothetical protein